MTRVVPAHRDSVSVKARHVAVRLDGANQLVEFGLGGWGQILSTKMVRKP